MKIVVTGSSGLIGSALVRVLRSEDEGHAHEVLRLVRREASAPDEISWDPAAGRGPDVERLRGRRRSDQPRRSGPRRPPVVRRATRRKSSTAGCRRHSCSPKRWPASTRSPRYCCRVPRSVSTATPATASSMRTLLRRTDFAATVAREWEEAAARRQRRRHPHGVPAHRHCVEHQGRRARKGAAAVQGRARRPARLGPSVPQLDCAP